MIRVGLAALTLAALASPVPVLAQAEGGSEGDAPGLEDETNPPEDDEARALFERGNAAYSVGQYADAAGHFREAYELSGRADLLYNIYSALEREGGHLEEATDALEQYLEQGDVPADRYAALSARLERMKTRLAEQQDSGDPREGGTHVEPADSGGVHPAATALLIAGGVLLVNFGIFAALSAAEKGKLESSCAPACNDDEVSTLSTYNLIADISWITALAAGATGVVLLFALMGGDESESAVSVSPWLAPGTGGAAVRGTF